MLLGAIFYKATYQSSKPALMITVATEKVETTQYTSTLSALGHITAMMGVTVKASSSGNITKLNVTSNQEVKKGQILLEIDPDKAKAKLLYDQAQLQLDAANLSRNKTLYQKNALDKATLDIAEATYKKDLALVKQDKATLNDQIIRAPFTGEAGIVNLQVGSYVNTADDLFSLQTVTPIYVDFSLPSKDQAYIKKNQDVTIELDAYPNQHFKGKVVAINNIIDHNTNSILLRAKLENNDGKLKPGDLVNITLDLTKPQQVIIVPTQAITYDNNNTTIFTVNQQNIVKQQVVVLGTQVGTDKVIVQSGLHPQEVIVIAGTNKITDGIKVVTTDKGEGN
ncbi:efflux RND transporter periplasmic adaptor subunit [Facilibium subflavum]|uniref:efflux RND transporter periplasmic adaptor subunit n=1 Tax=Facilibium subflavum TaxID=2219058 RepID=UPI0013C2CAC8|nr:efflux RND transporter periplasmic adaptor subunit [Facilibium subflavum]